MWKDNQNICDELIATVVCRASLKVGRTFGRSAQILQLLQLILHYCERLGVICPSNNFAAVYRLGIEGNKPIGFLR